MKKDSLSDQFLVNDQIRAREVRIVGDGIESKVVSLREALSIADDMELDLVMISPNAVPPVCRASLSCVREYGISLTPFNSSARWTGTRYRDRLR